MSYKTKKDASNTVKNAFWAIGAIMFCIAMGFLIWLFVSVPGLITDIFGDINFTGG